MIAVKIAVIACIPKGNKAGKMMPLGNEYKSPLKTSAKFGQKKTIKTAGVLALRLLTLPTATRRQCHL